MPELNEQLLRRRMAMLNFFSNRRYRDCEGAYSTRVPESRHAGSGHAHAAAAAGGASRGRLRRASQSKDTSVVWLWLGGGPTHVETFDPKMSAPAEYRSVTGEVATNVPGVTLGGTFPKMASVADKMAFVRSFAHTNSGHGGGTHFVMTGYDNRNIDNGGLPTRPSIGSIVSRVRGANHHQTGMPTYVRLGGIGADGPAFLGPAFAPFDPSGQARRNMSLAVPEERMRRSAETAGKPRHDQPPHGPQRPDGRARSLRAAGLQPDAGQRPGGVRYEGREPQDDRGLRQGPGRAAAACPPAVRGGVRLRDRELRRLGHARHRSRGA